MPPIQGDYIYTHTGWQRPVFLCLEETQKFTLEVMEGDAARLEVSYAPADAIRHGDGHWAAFEGGLGGSLEGATAVRVHVLKCTGWVTLRVA